MDKLSEVSRGTDCGVMEDDLYDHWFHQVAMPLEALHYCLSKTCLDP
jgi:hypothetical protein